MVEFLLPGMLLRLIAPLLANLIGLYTAAKYIPGVDFQGPWWALIIAALLLSLLHIFIKPVLKILAFPLIFLTAGFFSFLINLGILWFADKLIEELTIDGIGPLLLTTLLLSVIHFII